ncbi:MAG: signal recognition particle-docking protein FtsY, partial [Chloroflexi bacterium]|nr:signal recognition particle-docking protein FtsY [Chloroflexota bacterium]
IVDTAGRLHTKQNLMEEMKKVYRVLARLDPDVPDEVLLVLDATTGQNGLAQARSFTQAVGCTGVFLAKLDGTARGGIVVPIVQELGLPVLFVGTGESVEDMAPFEPREFVEELFSTSR